MPYHVVKLDMCVNEPKREGGNPDDRSPLIGEPTLRPQRPHWRDARAFAGCGQPAMSA